MKFLYYFIAFLQVLSAILLIGIVLMQESKNEGLTGQIGTTVTSSFKGKAGKEERLIQYTRNLAIIFFVLSTIVAVTTGRWN
ncbi:hypothetical protein LBMAG21_08190 [Armatimonadota bacterium]|nr:preprotein translocase subunit SecG [Armatimonadota bacterium]GDX40527.1 hypothetical protein LBMAG21_08190 [Armatimonadota bacterium]